jgi:MOSC domain-containing protein YiiM
MAELTAIGYRKIKSGPMFEVHNVKVTKAEGLTLGLPRRASSRQITVLCEEQWQQACMALTIILPWTARRANLLISGIQFNAEHIGKVMHIGQLQLLITGETEPCFKMDLVHPGLCNALNNFKAGVTCKVLNDADIQIGDSIHITEQLPLF